jgi:hypothetical protein
MPEATPASEAIAAPAPARQAAASMTVWLSVTLTLAYLFFELRFNCGLLDMVAQPNLSQATIAAMTTEGKALLAIGLS